MRGDTVNIDAAKAMEGPDDDSSEEEVAALLQALRMASSGSGNSVLTMMMDAPPSHGMQDPSIYWDELIDAVTRPNGLQVSQHFLRLCCASGCACSGHACTAAGAASSHICPDPAGVLPVQEYLSSSAREEALVMHTVVLASMLQVRAGCADRVKGVAVGMQG